MDKIYPVYTLKNECNDCYKCIRQCHIKAIKIQSERASVINDKCIACGHCVTVYPAGAKRVRNDIETVKNPDFSMEQIVKTLRKINKFSLEDELNCSGCGYSNCRDFVNALIAGDAETSMCVSYMRKIAVKKASIVLKCMPSAVVIVDSNFKIVEANDSFLHMFCEDMYEVFSNFSEGLSGALLDKVVPFAELFKAALSSGQDLEQKHYASGNKLYDINIFSIEDNELIGAVISDVTKTETDRSKIAQKAREVITKNIATVQEIASLLGEHMVETELLLNSIAKGYESDTEKDKKGNVYLYSKLPEKEIQSKCLRGFLYFPKTA